MKEMEMRTLTAIILGEADAHIRLAITCWGIIYWRSYNRYDFPPKFLRFCPKYQHLVMMFKKDDDDGHLTDHSGCQCRGYQVHHWSWWLRLKRRHLPRIISPKLLQVFVRANIKKITNSFSFVAISGKKLIMPAGTGLKVFMMSNEWLFVLRSKPTELDNYCLPLLWFKT